MHGACASGLDVALRCTDDLERVTLAQEETGDNVGSGRKSGCGKKGKKHLPFCSSVNEEVMGTEVKLMRQEADILRTCYYQDWVWHEYWTFQALCLNSYFMLNHQGCRRYLCNSHLFLF
ncbi:uncharacterized [Tachysurus ichikawai]